MSPPPSPLIHLRVVHAIPHGGGGLRLCLAAPFIYLLTPACTQRSSILHINPSIPPQCSKGLSYAHHELHLSSISHWATLLLPFLLLAGIRQLRACGIVFVEHTLLGARDHHLIP